LIGFAFQVNISAFKDGLIFYWK